MKYPRDLLIDSIRLRLAKRAAALRHSLEVEGTALADEAEEHHLADVGDLAGDAATDEPLARLVDHENDELEQVDRAMRRIDEGRFGLCEDCDAEIPDDRLIALPTATRCVGCQAAAEAPGEDEGEAVEDERRERQLAAIEEMLVRREQDDAEESAQAS